MKVRYIGEGETCDVFGHTFYRFKWNGKHTLADDEVERLAGNPQFEVEGGEVATDDEPQPEPEPEVVESDEPEAEETEPEG